MPEIEIRPLILSDWPHLIRIEHHFQTQHVWQMERIIEDTKVSINFREVRLPRPLKVELARPINTLVDEKLTQPNVLVAAVNGTPIGYIGMVDRGTPGTMWVSHLAVHQNTRRAGIASALVMAGQELALHLNYRRIIIELQSKNRPAIFLARKMGYEFCGYNDQYYANQDIAIFFGKFLR